MIAPRIIIKGNIKRWPNCSDVLLFSIPFKATKSNFKFVLLMGQLE